MIMFGSSFGREFLVFLPTPVYSPHRGADSLCHQTYGGAGVHLGVGGEGFFNRFVGVGAEAGYVGGSRTSKSDAGILSPNFVARFLAKDDKNKVEPFVTGGYTLFYHQETYTWYYPNLGWVPFTESKFRNGANLGAGVNLWASERIGVRFEFRDYILLGNYGTIHFAGGHIGLTFR
jgi:opacity protein-like surface antigen